MPKMKAARAQVMLSLMVTLLTRAIKKPPRRPLLMAHARAVCTSVKTLQAHEVLLFTLSQMVALSKPKTLACKDSAVGLSWNTTSTVRKFKPCTVTKNLVRSRSRPATKLLRASTLPIWAVPVSLLALTCTSRLSRVTEQQAGSASTLSRGWIRPKKAKRAAEIPTRRTKTLKRTRTAEEKSLS